MPGSPTEERSEGEREFEKERETKDDGRYIIFYAFAGEEPEGGRSGEEDVD